MACKYRTTVNGIALPRLLLCDRTSVAVLVLLRFVGTTFLFWVNVE